MKYVVQLDYLDFGDPEPLSIYFKGVNSGDIEYTSAYDTKREALEAFCLGQYAINQLRKEGEAEQKKEEKKKRSCEDCENAEWCFHGWHCKRFGQYIKMDRQTCIADEREEEQRKFVDLSRYCKTAIFDPSKPTIEERLAKIEERLTEIEGVLSSIGSPEWELRKKVDALEKKQRCLLADYKRHLCVSHSQALGPKDMELIMQCETEE